MKGGLRLLHSSWPEVEIEKEMKTFSDNREEMRGGKVDIDCGLVNTECRAVY